MTITEPTTLITDYLLAALVFLLGARLWRTGGRPDRTAVRLWAGAFAASGAAALLGGTFHGFIQHLSPAMAVVLWKGTVWSVGLAGLLLLAGAFRGTLSGPLRLVMTALAVLKFLVYAGWMATHDAFVYVIADYAPSLMLVLVLAVIARVRYREPSAPWIVAGILVSFAAAGIQAAHVSPHPRFNHNDLYHVVQMGAFYLLFRGGTLLKDRP